MARPELKFEHSFHHFLREALQVEDIAQKTILYSDINQIVHIFYLLRHYGRPIQLTTPEGRYCAVVSDIRSGTAILQLQAFQERDLLKCELDIEMAEESYKLEVGIRHIDKGQVTISIPPFFKNEESRSEIRVTPREGGWVRFSPLHQPLSKERSISSQLKGPYLPLVRELEQENPNLKAIQKLLAEEARRLSFHTEIQIQKERGSPCLPDSEASLAEKAIIATGQMLYIPQTDSLESYINSCYSSYEANHETGQEAGQKERLGGQAEARSLERTRQWLQKIQAEDQRKGLTSYGWAPLWLLGAAAGYIKIYSTIYDHRLVDSRSILHLKALATLLSYTLSKAAVCQQYYARPRVRLNDISMNGLSFQLQEKKVLDFLASSSSLKLIVEVRGKVLELYGRVAHFSRKGEGYHVGIRFYKEGAGVAMELENIIYELVGAEYREPTKGLQ